jgi:DivIVA domain-containing protein
MDSASPSGSILDTLRTVEFRLNLKGYNVDEVDEYLEKAAVEAEALHEQVRQMTERLRQATDRIAQLETERREARDEDARSKEKDKDKEKVVAESAEPRVSEETLQRTLLMAQQFVDQTKRESETEAADRVAKADEKARVTVAEAEERARTLTTEAEQRLREEVTRLEGLRGQLATDVETMARHLEQERNRLRGALSEVLKWVEDNVQPANSLMALRPNSGDAARPAAAATRPGDGGGPSPSTGSQTPSSGSPNPGTGAADPSARPPVRPTPTGHGPNGTGVSGADTGAGGGAQVLDLRGPTPGDRS